MEFFFAILFLLVYSLQMEFLFATLFLLIYYLRPQDWVPGMSGVQLVQPLAFLWILTLLLGRSRPSPLPGLFRTPHDWILVGYLAYIVFFADGSLSGILPLLSFYLLTVHSVNTWPRMLRYLTVWNTALFAIAAIGVLSQFGFDPTGARENEFTLMGRLAIGTWLHNNPNALAHSIVVVIPGAYLLHFWKGTMPGRWVLFPLMAGATFHCAWLTQSKGAYLVGATLVLLAFILGKPRWLQATAVAAALVVGVSALSFLPRMSDMNNLRGEEGVQGRLLAWEMAKTSEENNPTGVGWQEFIAMVPWKEGNQNLIIPKATHSSYVQVGADLGRYGLFLYLAGIWCALHTLLAFKASDTIQERCRRVLLVFLIGNVLSGWMINRQYHTEYFLLIAASAALHRLKKAEEFVTVGDGSPAPTDARPGAVAPDNTPEPAGGGLEPAPVPAFVPARPAPPVTKPFWNRFGILDFATCIGLTWLTFRTWDYVLKNL